MIPAVWWLIPPGGPSLQVRTLEYIKQQAQQPGMAHIGDMVQRLTLQSRT